MPWATFLINVSGCALIGVLMVTITELTSPHRLVRPLLGLGVLGGYTTFSTYSVEIHQMLAVGRPGLALTSPGPHPARRAGRGLARRKHHTAAGKSPSRPQEEQP